ncbi:MAG: hypothetical protein NW206_19350 [Hyphomonadaceae bacterium]|nr:hypothetical protein [Hyphomonadaceae bacterium]
MTLARLLLALSAFIGSAGAAFAQSPAPAAPIAPAALSAPAPPIAPDFPPPPPGVHWMRYARATEVQLRGVAAVVYVTPQSRPDIEVAVAHRGGVPGIELSARGRRLQIDGRLEREIGACRVEPNGAFQVQVGDNWLGADRLPTIYLRVPLEANISVAGAVQVRMQRGQSVRLNMSGCGDADLEGVDGAADITVAGDRPRVRLYDSGAAAIRIAGDGDILLGVVRESLAVSIAGDGDFVAAHVDGPTNIAITGDGEALVREGRAQPMSVTILGEGRVTHNGEADRLDVAIFGDGAVRVREVNGPVSRRIFGDGSVIVGGS